MGGPLPILRLSEERERERRDRKDREIVKSKIINCLPEFRWLIPAVKYSRARTIRWNEEGKIKKEKIKEKEREREGWKSEHACSVSTVDFSTILKNKRKAQGIRVNIRCFATWKTCVRGSSREGMRDEDEGRDIGARPKCY